MDDPVMVKSLLDHGARIDLKDQKGYTVLHRAIVMRRAPEMLQMFLEKAAELQNTQHINILNEANKQGLTPLSAAFIQRDRELIKDLLQRGADPVIASKNLEPDPWQRIIARLLDEIKDKPETNNEGPEKPKNGLPGITPITDEMVQSVKPTGLQVLAPVLEALKNNLNVDINRLGYTFKGIALHQAIWFGDQAIIQALLDRGADVNRPMTDEIGYTPLHLAASELNNKQVIEGLLNKGANINSQDKEGNTPLHLAVDKQNHASLQALLANNQIDLNIPNKNGFVPLYIAIWFGKKDIIDLLLKHRPNLDIQQEKNGYTPLHVAIAKSDKTVVKLLLDQGASIDLPNEKVNPVLHFSIINQDVTITQMLLDKADQLGILQKVLNLKNKEGKTPLDEALKYLDVDRGGIKLLIEKGANIQDVQDMPDENKQVFLHKAVWNNRKDIVDILVKIKDKLDTQDKDGYTPLHLAVFTGNEAITKILLDHEAKLDLADEKGDTPLHQSIAMRNPKITQLLLEKAGQLGNLRAILNTPNKAGKTPLSIAFMQANEGLIKTLLDKGADLNVVKQHASAQEKGAIDALLTKINYPT